MGNTYGKNILFLSALDFKEKSIQVIRKTPEAYAQRGWNVHYLVARDTSKASNYFYENEINPTGVFVYRLYWPLTLLANRCRKRRYLNLIINKTRGMLVILLLAIHGMRLIKQEHIDIVYGYEMHGVLAVKWLSLFGLLKNKAIVTRFQGSFIFEMIENQEYLRLIWNHDVIAALRFPADLTIMTNDGTQGDKALELINSRTKRYVFWPNGCDFFELNRSVLQVKKDYNISDEFVILTVCRLVKWKRVDRGLNVVAKLTKDFGIQQVKYFIIGDGEQKTELEQMAHQLEITDKVVFCGPITYDHLGEYYHMADAVLLTYDHSNVGNPLLEAVRMNKYIFTLNNGDTSRWIKHKHNGFIYDINNNLLDRMSSDMAELITNTDQFEYIKKNLQQTAKEKLWTWQERMDVEINEVSKILDKMKVPSKNEMGDRGDL